MGFKIENGVLKKYIMENSETKVVIHDGVTSIGNMAFYNCIKLETINIPDSVTSIDSSAFVGTKWLKNKQNEDPFVIINDILIDDKLCEGEVKIPDNVTTISRAAFENCKKITSITIPDGVTSIDSNTFSGCIRLKEISISDSVTNIGYRAFYGCKKLESITIPDGVTNIEVGAFYGCKKLESITIPDSVTNIGNCAFYECKSLESITLPDSVTNIEEYTFYGCKFYYWFHYKIHREKWIKKCKKKRRIKYENKNRFCDKFQQFKLCRIQNGRFRFCEYLTEQMKKNNFSYKQYSDERPACYVDIGENQLDARISCQYEKLECDAYAPEIWNGIGEYGDYKKEKDIDQMMKKFLDIIGEFVDFSKVDDLEKLYDVFLNDLKNNRLDCDVYMGQTD